METSAAHPVDERALESSRPRPGYHLTEPNMVDRPVQPGPCDFSRVRFFKSLDGLRALSILGVLWMHAWFVSGPEYLHQLERIPVLRMGTFGVDVFFGISGFLITTLLLRGRSKNGKVSLRSFYLRRSLRIWPLYYATLFFYVLLVTLLQRGTG